jgi:hypothetical protein
MKVPLLMKLRTLARFGVERVFVPSTHFEQLAREIVEDHREDLVDPLVLPTNANFTGLVFDGMQVINTGSEDEGEANRLNQDEAQRTNFAAKRDRFISGRT